MNSKDEVDNSFNEIAANFVIPYEFEPILRNALAVRHDVETSFSEAEKQVLPYIKIISSIDLHIAEIIKRCRKKSL